MADIKWSQFPSATPGNADEVVGLKSGGNVLFSIANIVAAVRNGLASIFVPLTRTINGKGLSADISLDSSDIDYDNTQSGLTATDVQEAIDELAQGGGGGGSAADITYDPTISGLSATDVQDAIDEVVTDLGDKQDEITASGILKGDGAGGVSAATPGTDYQAPLTAGTDYTTPAQLAGKANIDEIGIVVNGNSSTQGADIGQYVILRNSTIPYRADGLYRAAKPIPANTAIDWSYIGSVDGGGLNSLNARMPRCGNVSFTVTQNGATTVQVVFDVPFPQGTSYAVCVCQSGQYAYSNLDFGSTNRTETGFDVTVSSTRSGTFTGNAFLMAIPY